MTPLWLRSLLLACLCSVGLVATALGQELATEPTRVSPGASTRVWIMAAWDDNCRALPAPLIDITAKPTKGTIVFREGQSTTVKSSHTGTCIGSRVTGTGVYYSALPDAEGADSFSIEARLASGETARRTFHMSIGN